MIRYCLRLLLAMGLISCGVGCTEDYQGGETEVYKGIEAEIRELNPDDPKQVDSLKQMIQERGWKQTRKIVELLHSEDEKMSQNAMGMLMELGDLSLTPLLEASEEASPEARVRDLKLVVESQLDNRNRIARILEAMLTDKTVLPPKILPIGVEEVPPTRRVCDEAYLMMRLLFAVEDEEKQFDHKDAFLDLTDDQRDIEIERARKTKKWTILIE
jgi:hypothetical protein